MTTLLRGCCFAGAAYLLVLPNFSAFRLELVFVPMCTFGIAMLVEHLAATVRRRSRWAGQPT